MTIGCQNVAQQDVQLLGHNDEALNVAVSDLGLRQDG
jgi:hypothetical protein